MSFSLNPYTPPDFDREPLASAPDAKLVPAPLDGVAPEGYHAMSIYPEYFKIDGSWLLAKDSRMDCVPVYEDGRIFVREFRHIRAGDAVVLRSDRDGRAGHLRPRDGFDPAPDGDGELAGAGRHADNFAFRLGRSRETAFSREYDELYELLRYERDHGYVVWVMGPAFSFNGFSRTAFLEDHRGRLRRRGLRRQRARHARSGGVVLPHRPRPRHRDAGEPPARPLQPPRHHQPGAPARLIARFIEEEQVCGGIMHALEKKGVPYVLAGSIRDDGPLPSVIGNAYEAQDAMRDHLRKATTVVCMATMLHTIATGNMTPSYRVLPDGTVRQVYFYCVGHRRVRGVNKLIDRGSLASRGIVTNVAGLHRERGEGAGAVTSPRLRRVSAAHRLPPRAPPKPQPSAATQDAHRPPKPSLRPTARPASERRPYSPSVPCEASVHPSAATHSTATAMRAAFGTRRLFAGTMSMARSPPSAPAQVPAHGDARHEQRVGHVHADDAEHPFAVLGEHPTVALVQKPQQRHRHEQPNTLVEAPALTEGAPASTTSAA